MLERLQPRREGRLGNAQHLRGATDVAAPSDVEEALYLCQLHLCMIDFRYPSLH
jgi:hypothetical protein